MLSTEVGQRTQRGVYAQSLLSVCKGRKEGHVRAPIHHQATAETIVVGCYWKKAHVPHRQMDARVSKDLRVSKRSPVQEKITVPVVSMESARDFHARSHGRTNNFQGLKTSKEV